ncbi:hypothetical protein NW759_017131, partial [Fusarium solani]
RISGSISLAKYTPTHWSGSYGSLMFLAIKVVTAKCTRFQLFSYATLDTKPLTHELFAM